MLEKGQECGQCGTSTWQWEQDGQAFVAVQHVCMGCAAKARMQEGNADALKVPGSSVKLVTRDTAARLMTAPRKRPMSLREKAGKT